MDPLSAIAAFSIAAALLTVTPGLDTALVLRTATVEGSRPAILAGLGVVMGVLAWGLLASLGLGAVLTASQIGYRLLQYAGAAYIVWLGACMVLGACRRTRLASARSPGGRAGEGHAGDRGKVGGTVGRKSVSWFWRGLMTNLLNPKVGVFYVSFLPQFIPADVPVVAFSVALAAIHAVMGLVWFSALTLATRPLTRLLRSPLFTRGIDGLTGTVLIAFGIRLAFQERA